MSTQVYMSLLLRRLTFLFLRQSRKVRCAFALQETNNQQNPSSQNHIFKNEWNFFQ